MHPLVKRQLGRYLKPEAQADPAIAAFVRAVDDAYVAADEERVMLERTIELTSKELLERNDALRADIKAREAAENERDAFFRMSPDMLCIVNARLEFLQVNPSWQRQLGYSLEALQGRQLLDLVHPDDKDRTVAEASALAESGRTVGFENRYRTDDGQWKRLQWTATSDMARGLFFAVARDVTAQRNMERELAQAQKMEAVGGLASGVAHEINTPIQFIGDNVQFVADSFAECQAFIARARQLATQQAATADELASLTALGEQADLDYVLEEVPRSLREAKDGVRRVAELVRALKEYAHPDAPEKTLGDINLALDRTLVLARNELKYVADIKTELGPLPPVACHIGSLQQVFLNILINAAHAVEERQKKDGQRGAIKVSSRVDGADVVVSISDTGCGIPADIRERIFEPFFTTKPMGKGSGQGLPLVRNVIVDKHQGRVDVSSEVGVGTTFELRLPTHPRKEG
jgi:PAS domain S-box-containing protein